MKGYSVKTCLLVDNVYFNIIKWTVLGSTIRFEVILTKYPNMTAHAKLLKPLCFSWNNL